MKNLLPFKFVRIVQFKRPYILLPLLLTVICSVSCHSQQAKSPYDISLPPINIKIEKVADNLQAPLAAVFPGDGRMFVVEQTGTIRVFKNGVENPVPFLDIHDKMVKLNGGYDERGLLGLALHPDFIHNHKFYIYYSASTTGGGDNKGTLAEYKVSATNPDVANVNSGRILFTVEHPESNHNGGCLQFGPDGYLYISEGDGGGGGDRHGDIGNGQNLGVFLGKILRIDVNKGNPYAIPADNPFVNKPGAKPEIYAYGMRNTWRYSFDKASKKLFAGDVGQDTWEEVDIITKGANYGWRITEATHCFNPSTGCDFKGITMPIAEYSHHEGISITGGYIYNGKQLPGLTGKYIFADWSGPMFYLQKSANNTWKRGKIVIDGNPGNLKNTSFGEDSSGELYIVTSQDTGPNSHSGAVYKIVKE
jgi:glucose/arabinose dehydrogenase